MAGRDSDDLVHGSDVLRDDEAPASRRPMRTCVGCRRQVTKDELLRVVASQRGPGLSVAPDPGGRAPGRGAYLHLSEACLRLALRRRAFPRALRAPGPLEVEHLATYVAQFQPDPDRIDREMWSSGS